MCSVDTNGVPCGTLYYRSSEDLARLDLACSTSSARDRVIVHSSSDSTVSELLIFESCMCARLCVY